MKSIMGKILGIALMAQLLACGGGGDSGTQNLVPTANAGSDITSSEQTTVSLSGSGSDSDGSVAGYSWTQTGGETVTLTNPTSSTTSFEAPVTTEQLTLTFSLTVTDNQGATGVDSVSVTVTPVNTLPGVSAGDPQNVVDLAEVTLTAVATDDDGEIATYSWTQTDGDTVSIENADTAEASFIVPAIVAPKSFTFKVTVTDNEDGQAVDEVIVNASPAWSDIASLGDHTIALKTNGTLWAWGKNNYGQVGDGTLVNRLTPVQVGIATDWDKIYTGYNFSIAIKSDGSLWAWGFNGEGELGLNDTENRITPTQVGTDTDWSTISANNVYVLGLKTDGSLWSWGSDSNDVLGHSEGTSHELKPTQVGTSTDWASVSAGRIHAHAIKADGSLWAWGTNNNNAFGNNSSESSGVPIQIGSATDWSSVAAGYRYGIAIRQNGSLWAWGDNYYGQLGIGSTTDSDAIVQVGEDSNWRMVYSSGNTSYGVKSNGSLLAWGNNVDGQVGDGSTSDRNRPNLVSEDSNWKSVTANYFNALALKESGELWSWGYNANGTKGDDTLGNRGEPGAIESTTDWDSFAAGGYFNAIVKTDGTLWTWGSNALGRLGNSTEENVFSPEKIGASTDWKELYAGLYATLAIKTDGTLWGWGYSVLDSYTVETTPGQIGSASNWKEASVGSFNKFAIQTDGTLWGWGQNFGYELGLGDNADRDQPVQIGSDTNWKSVSNFESHTIALKEDGTLWGWGTAYFGELGTGSDGNVSQTTPSQIGTDSDWSQISAGRYYSLAIKADGSLWAWGWIDNGVLGIESEGNILVPTKVNESSSKWVKVKAGYRASFGLKEDGTLWGWGTNYNQELGQGKYNSLNYAVPTQVISDTLWSDFDYTIGHVIARSTENEFYSWGYNRYGQLGFVPEKILSPEKVDFVEPTEIALKAQRQAAQKLEWQGMSRPHQRLQPKLEEHKNESPFFLKREIEPGR